jgi:hypothetical protein
MPVESAPRGKPLLGEDGPLIEVRHANGSTTFGYFGRGIGGIGPRWNDGLGRAMSKPTHWRPKS